MYLFGDDIFDAMRSSLFEGKYLDVDDKKCAARRVLCSNKRQFISNSYKQRKKLLVQPRGGFGTVEKHTSLLKALQQAGADVLPCTIDSNTRLNDFQFLDEIFENSEKKEVFLQQLNGFPLIHHGHNVLYNAHKDIGLPVSLRHGSPDPRILCEVALMSGIYEIEGGGICYNLPYSRDYPIGLALRNWAYVDKLCASLSTDEKPISRESFGPLTATLVPPFMVITVQILEMLMALDKGVKFFSVSFGQMGNLKQDYVTAESMRRVISHFTDKYDQKDKPTISLVYHHWMGAFPTSEEHSNALISIGTMSAKICEADKIVIKTTSEARSIPDETVNSKAIKLVDYLIRYSKDLPHFSWSEVEEEVELLVEQALFLINEILKYSDILEVCVIRAIEMGLIDIPFSPHQKNQGMLWCMRDEEKNIRVSDFGRVPTITEFKKFELMQSNSGSKSNSISGILDDINAMIS